MTNYIPLHEVVARILNFDPVDETTRENARKVVEKGEANVLIPTDEKLPRNFDIVKMNIAIPNYDPPGA